MFSSVKAGRNNDGTLNTVRVYVDVAGQEAVDRAAALLQGIPDGLEKAMDAAMNKAVRQVRRDSADAIRERYDISRPALRTEQNVRVHYSHLNGIQATITFAGKKIPLYRFGGAYPVRPTKDLAAGKMPVKSRGAWTMQYPGVAARGHQLNSTAPAQFQDAFVARMESGHVGIFERTGGETEKGSDAIQELMGSSIPQMLGHEQVAKKITDEAYETFESELDKAVLRILQGQGWAA